MKYLTYGEQQEIEKLARDNKIGECDMYRYTSCILLLNIKKVAVKSTKLRESARKQIQNQSVRK